MKLNLLSDHVLEKLKRHVAFERPEDAAQMIADAINVYIKLGQIERQGGRVYVRPGSDGEVKRLLFPFSDLESLVTPADGLKAKGD